MATPEEGDRTLERRCCRAFKQLKFRRPFGQTSLQTAVERYRGKPLKIAFSPLYASTSGMWYGYDDHDLIVIDVNTVRRSRRHTFLHEVGHIMMGHPSDNNADDVVEQSTPWVGAVTRAKIVCRRRTCFDSRYEREAECFATVGTEWMDRTNAVLADAVDDPSEDLLDAVAGHPRL